MAPDHDEGSHSNRSSLDRSTGSGSRNGAYDELEMDSRYAQDYGNEDEHEQDLGLAVRARDWA